MPDASAIRDICTDRLARWTGRLVAEHSTPVILLGVGHDAKRGQLTVLTCEEVSDAELRAFLAFALTQIGG